MSAPVSLRRSYFTRRALVSGGMTALAIGAALVAMAPLLSVLGALVSKGAWNFRWSMLTSLPPSALDEGGGFGNALLGTLIMTGIGGAIAFPLGILAAIYLAEFGGGRAAPVIRFAVRVLSGVPSIIAGVFAYGIVVLTFKSFSAWAGGVALAVLMIPVVVIAAEQALRAVPGKLREAAYGMGATRFQAIWRVVLPTAFSGVCTGCLLAIARAGGETAPLLFTAQFSNFWISGLNEPTPSMSVLIHNMSGRPSDHLIAMAWTASFVLVVAVLGLNLLGRSLAPKE